MQLAKIKGIIMKKYIAILIICLSAGTIFFTSCTRDKSKEIKDAKEAKKEVKLLLEELEALRI